MKSITRDLVEYSGIDDCLPLDVDSFKQINVDGEVCIPVEKPDMEQLCKVQASATIKNTRVIKTPKGVSLEGFKLTGHKLIIEGNIHYKVQYVALEEAQSVHLAHFDVPFMNFIVLPEGYMPSTILAPSVFVEDIYANPINERCMFINATLLLTAEVC